MIIRIKRLPTRDIRENLDEVRKKLWEVSIFSILKLVVLRVSKNYEAIYYKHITGSQSCKKSHLCVSNHYLDLPFLKLSIIAWRGREITETFKRLKTKDKLNLVQEILDYLYCLNSQNQKTINVNLQNYRYLTLFIDELDKLNRKKSALVQRKLNLLFGRHPHTIVGFGLEDPVLSNFNLFRDKLCLVDLDNFSKTINLFYEFGFLLADLEIDYKCEQADLKKCWELYRRNKKIILKKSNKIHFLLGYVSRYAILFLNIRKNPKFDYRHNINRTLNRIYHSLDSIPY